MNRTRTRPKQIEAESSRLRCQPGTNTHHGTPQSSELIWSPHPMYTGYMPPHPHSKEYHDLQISTRETSLEQESGEDHTTPNYIGAIRDGMHDLHQPLLHTNPGHYATLGTHQSGRHPAPANIAYNS
ncbi:Hypothetical predicted protein [Pelobates cultripes]|uniref:Uncharacterized protein n=1 Tax=Pelobates cultripes TaxID=61616 RepID=A0AAD1VRW4_PELCU|nr:Hypothetical predicted protein [Pelobates cultripes]